MRGNVIAVAKGHIVHLFLTGTGKRKREDRERLVGRRRNTM